MHVKICREQVHILKIRLLQPCKSDVFNVWCFYICGKLLRVAGTSYMDGWGTNNKIIIIKVLGRVEPSLTVHINSLVSCKILEALFHSAHTGHIQTIIT